MEQRKSSTEERQKSIWTVGTVSVLAYLALTVSLAGYLIWFHIVSGYRLSHDTADWASFGDFFGGTVGPFIGFASIILLVETLKLQRRGLEEQREHLEATTREAAEQNRIILRQSFEQSFFTWLRDYKNSLDQVVFSSHAQVSVDPPYVDFRDADLVGRKALERIAELLGSNLFNDLYHRASPYGFKLLTNDEQEAEAARYRHAMSTTWIAIHNSESGSLRASIRTLYGLLRWIDGNEALTSQDKEHYTSIIKAQLTEPEMLMLYANGVTEKGAEFAMLLAQYSLLSDLNQEQYPVLRRIPQVK